MIGCLIAQLTGGVVEAYKVRKYATWTLGDVRKVLVVANYLFVSHRNGVKVLTLPKLKDKVGDRRLFEYPTEDRPVDVEYYGEMVYIATNPPAAPTVYVVSFATKELKASLTPAGTIINTDISSKYLFVLTSFGINVYDLSDPSNPVEFGDIPFSGFTGNSMKVYFPYVYVAAGLNGLIVFKVEGNSIKKIYHYKPPDGSPVVDVEVYGRYIYLACAKGGLKVLNVEKAQNPLTYELQTEKPVFTLKRHRKYLLATFGSGGLKVYSLSRPSNPLLVAYYSNSQHLYDVDVYKNYILLAYGTYGILNLVSSAIR